MIYSLFAQCLWTEIDLQSIEVMNGTTARPIVFNLASKRIKRGLIGINGHMIINDDLHKYTAGVNIYYSQNGANANFVRSPINIQSGPLCDKFNNEYRKFIMSQMAKSSDLPVADKGDMCELIEQRKYTVDNYIVEVGAVPKFLQKGVYRVEIWMKDPVQVVSSGLFVMLSLS